MGRELSLEPDPDRSGHLEPEPSGRHGRRHVRGADSGRESTERPVGTGVGVRPDRKLSGGDESLLRNQSMLNPHISHIEIMRELLLRREVPADLSALCGDDVLVRDEMIHHEDDLIPVKDRLLSQLLHLPDRKRSRNIIPVDQIDIRLDQLPRQDLIEARMRRQNLLAHRHSHIILPSQFMQSFSSDTFPLSR